MSNSPRSVATDNSPAGLFTTITDLSENNTSGSGIEDLYLPDVSSPSDFERTVSVVPGEILMLALLIFTPSTNTRP